MNRCRPLCNFSMKVEVSSMFWEEATSDEKISQDTMNEHVFAESFARRLLRYTNSRLNHKWADLMHVTR
jgi:hypothetical protein